MPGWCGWLDTDNKTISVHLDLTGTATGTELGKTLQKEFGRKEVALGLKTLAY